MASRKDPPKVKTKGAVVPVSQTLTRVPRADMDYADEVTDAGQAPAAVMTHYASRSALVAEAVQRELEGKRYGGMPGRALKIAEPDGPSTDGGLKARQPILLVLVRGEGPALHCGWLDAARMMSQLKTWEAVKARHRARFGTDPDLPKASYETFLVDVRRALLNAKLQVQLISSDDSLPATATEDAAVRSSVPLPTALVLMAVTFALGILLGFLLRGR